MSGKRVVVAMSGGVDSSLAAALLKEQGYDVIGVMMRLWAEAECGVSRSNKCCTPEAVKDARSVADALDIPFYLLNVEQPFKQHVVDYFIDGYLQGVTPNPCLQCNRHIRLGVLYRHALALGADYLATGHYARVRHTGDGLYRLFKGVDERKDQSYVLYMVTQEHLAHLLFPVGDYTKTQVRAMAHERGLPTASRAESQDLCFVHDGDYRRFLRQWGNGAIRPGPILRTDGTRVGTHRGLPFYTIGQRKGLGLSSPEPLYVLALDQKHNAIIVGTWQELGRDSAWVEQVHWISGEEPTGPLRAAVKIRYKAREVMATLVPEDEDRVHVYFDEPLRDITPGQGAVFYRGDECLGGGILALQQERIQNTIRTPQEVKPCPQESSI